MPYEHIRKPFRRLPHPFMPFARTHIDKKEAAYGLKSEGVTCAERSSRFLVRLVSTGLCLALFLRAVFDRLATPAGRPTGGFKPRSQAAPIDMS